ncbi:unnamed protein product [Staurois parvus]|uniref:Uncharacterized protein n=1 Tax=Staurois parvus TaxID=386267 RepID=A0ABN9G2B9_9NEOB|nr:unnamed protein product [Staurois parvus]
MFFTEVQSAYISETSHEEDAISLL